MESGGSRVSAALAADIVPAPAPAPAFEPEADDSSESPPARPLTTRVAVEFAWLQADADGSGARIVTGPRPADAVEQLVTGRFRHESHLPAEGLSIVIQIPPGMQYVTGSATGPGANVSFSVDHGRSFAAAAALMVMPLGGTDSEPRPAIPADYTHIRWLLPGRHAPGTAGLVSFRSQPIEVATEAEAQ